MYSYLFLEKILERENREPIIENDHRLEELQQELLRLANNKKEYEDGLTVGLQSKVQIDAEG